MIAVRTGSYSSTFDEGCRVRDITSPDNSPTNDFSPTNTHLSSNYTDLSHLK
jgi:hypothetical protein